MSFLISLLICLVLWIAISCQLTVSINSVPQVEIDALYSLYNATGGASWTWGYTSITYENRNLTGMPWNFSTLNPNPCQSSPNSWEGINCFCADNETNATCHVTVIALGGHNLKGTLPAEIANLSYLEVFEVPVNLITSSLPDSWRQLKNMTVLSLGTNQLQFTVPDWIGELSSLRLLDMTFNNFTGSLPPSLFELSNIKYLLLSHNNLTGILPSQFSGWNQLENLSLTNNYFIGEIPPQICSLPHLQSVEISDNDFSSTIPSCIGNVFALTSLNMNGNQLSGTLPHSITNLTKLQHLNLQLNNLNGSIPQEIGRLSHLRTLVLQFNALTGTIPPQIVNCTELIILDLSRNLLWGTIPEGIRDLRKLVELYVGVMLLDGNITDRLPTSSLRSLVVRNNLFSGPFSSFNAMDPLTYLSGQSNIFSGSFPNEVFFMSAINTVILSENSFTGQLPAVIPHNSTMLSLATDSNALSGVLPCANDSYPIPLYDYFMNDNFFSGTLCSNIGTFSNLYHLDVSYNILSGTISKEISSLGNLYELFLSNNQFSGSLDGVLDSSRQHQLVLLDVSTNYFTSTLPGEIFRLPHLIFFSASTNCFEGTLPSTICGAVNMTSLVMDGLSAATRCRDRFFPWSSVLDGFQVLHHVHGQLPSCVFSWPHVTLLHIAGNGLTGTLPNFASLPHLLVNLSLAHNHLSGDIPSVFQHHSFFDIDLSYNRLGGMLDHDFAVPPPNGSIALHSNHLSGHVPSTLLDSINIQLLDGNLFSCRVDRTDLPAHDPKSDSYACGSDSMNYSLFAWLLEVIVLVGLALCFVYKLSNDSDEAFQKTLLFVVERFQNLIAVRSLRPKSLEKCEPNPIDDNNNRDDDLKDSPSSGKLGIKHQMSPMESLVSMWTLTLTVQSTTTAETCLSNFAAMHSFIRTVFLLLTLVSLLLLMPINVILNR